MPMFAIVKFLVLPMHEKGATLAVSGIPYFWELVSVGLGLLAMFLVGLGVKRITRGGRGERKQIWD